MEAHEARFSEFIVGDFKEYIRNMRRAGVWGGDPEIQSLSEIYARSVMVYCPDPKKGASLRRTFHEDLSSSALSSANGGGEGGGESPLPTVSVSYIGNSHFNSIRNSHHALNLLRTTPGVVEDFKIQRCRALKSQTSSQTSLQTSSQTSSQTTLQTSLQTPTPTFTLKQIVVWKQARELERYKLEKELKEARESRDGNGDFLLSDEVEDTGFRVGEVPEALLGAALSFGEGNEDDNQDDDDDDDDEEILQTSSITANDGNMSDEEKEIDLKGGGGSEDGDQDNEEESILLLSVRSNYRFPSTANDGNASDEEDWEYEAEDDDDDENGEVHLVVDLQQELQQEEQAKQDQQERDILKEKRNQATRNKKCEDFQTSHGIRCSNGQQYAALLKEDFSRGVEALRLVPVLYKELLELQDKMADIVKASEILKSTGRAPLFELLASAVLAQSVPVGHCSWALYETAFKNM
jgi:hypothetical protein